MIARLTGELATKEPNQVIVDAGGVGYLVFISQNCFYALPEPPAQVTLLIHTAVREDDISLYGFLTDLEKRLFGLLISVSKVGPKAAMHALSAMSAAELLTAIAAADAKTLSTIPGVGKKTAERIIVDLAEKAAKLMESVDLAAPALHSPLSNSEQDAVSALLNLGYKPADAEQVVNQVHRELGETAELPAIIRAALKRLAKG